MIKRKILTMLFAIPVSLFVIFAVFFGEWKQPFELVVMTGAFSLILSPIIILYGAPVSFLSEYLSKRFTANKRIAVAFVIHILFGVAFGIIFPFDASFSLFGVKMDLAIIFASITALFFWAIDELLRKNNFHTRLRCKCCYSFAK
ncbi:hypothetical protein SAMN05216389_101184 [Oceanobacillus limi]|uniref:Uncharacterized protein n=1 Tax=Oceanobacillus limi TaxID=930131 RepID=A0A1H9Y494_9BACI|nr:hypothetical protein [Oceanobacillus limi]SES63688.1 hypothetical protein SAMN05216389_101184 [Oceanobacillus limi]